MSNQVNNTDATNPVTSTEHTITDTTGRFTMAVQDGQQVAEISWLEGRIILSNQSLYLIGETGKLSVGFSEITTLSGQTEPAQTSGGLSKYVRIEYGNDVLIVSPADYDTFRKGLYTATIDGETINCKHPAVRGGVVQAVSWTKARVSVREHQLVMTLNDGTQARVELSEISNVTLRQLTINEAERQVICVSHIEDNSTVKTQLTASERTCMFIQSFLAQGAQRSHTDIDLTELEQELLLALHSGVRPFDIPEFIGADVETVEDAFDRLVAQGIVDRVRVRQEVELNATGRNIVADAFSE